MSFLTLIILVNALLSYLLIKRLFKSKNVSQGLKILTLIVSFLILTAAEFLAFIFLNPTSMSQWH